MKRASTSVAHLVLQPLLLLLLLIPPFSSLNATTAATDTTFKYQPTNGKSIVVTNITTATNNNTTTDTYYDAFTDIYTLTTNTNATLIIITAAKATTVAINSYPSVQTLVVH